MGSLVRHSENSHTANLFREPKRSSPAPHSCSADGSGLSLVPVMLVWHQSGATLNRHVIAVSQMLSSSLLIQIPGGRIETHFHVFGFLAFLAFYRDWRVLVTATIVTGLDHAGRPPI